MTEMRFDKFIALFEQVFDLKRGKWANEYDEGDFNVFLSYCDGHIWMTGEGKRFQTPEVHIGSIDLSCDSEDGEIVNPYIEFRDKAGNCRWFLRGETTSLIREYERLLFLCEEYSEEE